jgi:hypothetical protein
MAVADSTLYDANVPNIQDDALHVKRAPFAHTSIRPHTSVRPKNLRRDRRKLLQDRDPLLPLSSSSVFVADPSLACQLPEETVSANQEPDKFDATLLSICDPSADPPSHATVSSPPTENNLSISSILSGSLQSVNSIHLYRARRFSHLWYAIFTPRSGKQEVSDGFKIEFFPPPEKGMIHVDSDVYMIALVQKRVSKIEFNWDFLVSIMEIDKAKPAFFLLAFDNPVISLLGQRVLRKILQQLAVIQTPLHRRYCRSNKKRTSWISQNRQDWHNKILALNSRMAELDIALQVRHVLNYKPGTRLVSYARLDDTDIAGLNANKRDILLC